MKGKRSVSLREKHGQYYAVWRSIVIGDNGEEIEKQHDEPTGVPLPPTGSSDEKISDHVELAFDVGEYIRKLKSPRLPTFQEQQLKLKEFALRAAKLDGESLRDLVTSMLVHYAITPLERTGAVPKEAAVWKIVDTWDQVLTKLGDDRDLHPSLIEETKLQQLLNRMTGDRVRHKIDIQVVYQFGLVNGKVLRGQNPAEFLAATPTESFKRKPIPKEAIQRGLDHMETLKNGDQWQILTLFGVYTAMRIHAACGVKLMPRKWVRPEIPEISHTAAFLDTRGKDWAIEWFNTKARPPKWEREEPLDHCFVEWWLKPYLNKHGFEPGEYILPAIARCSDFAPVQWQEIMEKSGYPMVFSKYGKCLTGYHALRISRDQWLKEDGDGSLSPHEIETVSSRHTVQVHRKHYNSEVTNVGAQRRLNANLPKFVPAKGDISMSLFKIREEMRKCELKLEDLKQQEASIQETIKETEENAKKTDTTAGGRGDTEIG